MRMLGFDTKQTKGRQATGRTQAPRSPAAHIEEGFPLCIVLCVSGGVME